MKKLGIGRYKFILHGRLLIMKKTFDAVKMVREIRDKMHNQTKRMTFNEKMEFYRQKSKKLYSELDHKRYLVKSH